MITNPELEAAFRRTLYIAFLPDGEARFKVDVRGEALDQRLQREAGIQTDWAIVTPCNPGAQRLPDADNAHRLEEMQQNIETDGYRWHPAVNRDPTGQWPDENGFFIVDPGLTYATALAQRFGQHALLHGEIGSAPHLHWI